MISRRDSSLRWLGSSRVIISGPFWNMIRIMMYVLGDNISGFISKDVEKAQEGSYGEWGMFFRFFQI